MTIIDFRMKSVFILVLMTIMILPTQVAPFVVSKSKRSNSFQWCQNGMRLYGQKPSAEDVARKLKQEAKELRSQVDEFEQGKKDAIRRQEKEKKMELEAKKNRRLRYSAEVPILKGNGNVVVEQVDFPPVMPGNDVSEIISVEASLPLGIILGEHEKIVGAVQVDEVVEGSNGDLAGILVGDILRACTACQVTMTQPTWQLIAGGIGQPKTTRFMFSADKKPFEEIMDAIGSNRMDPSEQPLCLVFERKS